MKEKTSIITIILIFILGGFFYQISTFMTLDEDKILRETRRAYENIQFGKEPFLRKKEIQSLTDFLLRHIDEIKNYNRHKEYRKIRLSEGAWTSHYTNDGDCFIMPTFDSIFIKEYVPPKLLDSLIHYSNKLSDDLIVGLSVCSKQHYENIDSTKGSVSFVLNYEKKGEVVSDYYLNHNITQNLKFKENKTLHSIYDFGLTKDTVLLNALRYTIVITPYSGF